MSNMHIDTTPTLGAAAAPAKTAMLFAGQGAQVVAAVLWCFLNR